MKRASPGHDEARPRKGGIRWDEDNLEENERIKKELNPRKIDEPKTPYAGSPGTTDDELMEGSGVSSLSLEERERGAGGATAPAPPAPAGVAPILIHRPRSAWSDSDHAGSPSPRLAGSAAGRSPRFAGMDYYAGDSDDGEGGDQNRGGEGDGGDGAKVEKKRKFREARRAHYQMAEALAKAKELMEEEEGGGEAPEEVMFEAEGLNGAEGEAG